MEKEQIVIATNAAQVVKELDGVAAKSRELSAGVVAENGKIAASFLGLQAPIAAAGASVNALAAGFMAYTAAIAPVNEATLSAIPGMSLLGESLDTLTGSLTNCLTAWNALTLGIMLNTAALTANMTQELMSVLTADVLTVSLGVLTLAFSANTLFVAMNTAEQIANCAALLESTLCVNTLSLALFAYSAALLLANALLIVNTVELVVNAIAVAVTESLTAGYAETVKSLNKQLKSMWENLTLINIMLTLKSVLLLLASAASLAHTLVLGKENKTLETYKTKQDSANRSMVAGIGLKGFELGASAGFPVGLALGPAMGALFTGLAMGIVSIAGLAKGGVATGTTVAMIGEGKYPEAVVPLGSSPQFASMKSEIANAVLQGLAAMQRKSGGSGSAPAEIVLNLDGERVARAILPRLSGETRRSGYVFQTKGV